VSVVNANNLAVEDKLRHGTVMKPDVRTNAGQADVRAPEGSACGFRTSPLGISLMAFARSERVPSIGIPFILPPKHASVFRAAAADFSEYADALEDAGADETVFEGLTLGQKQLAILLVARALLDPAIEPPRITAVLAETMAAIYHHLQTMVAIEIDGGEGTKVRRMLLDALDESDQEPRAPLIPACQDTKEWCEIVESLEAAALKALSQIRPDYFVTTIADPSPQYLERIRQVLWSLLAQD
jgi:hypothetical protein